jgi:hypothetical protein
MTKNIKGLLHALQQSVNEAILESKDVAAAIAALKRTGKCPVFTVDISMQDPFGEAPEPAEDSLAELSDAPQVLIDRPRSSGSEELVLSDWDVQFLATLGVRDPSWSQGAPIFSKD